MRNALKRLVGTLPLHRWLRPAGEPVVVVLMYHDLCADGDLDNWLRVPVSRFESQLESLSGFGRFIAPEDLHDQARLPHDRLSFLVTFDDGYRNNLDLAAPILDRRCIPAVFFVSTGPLLSREAFWTDVVATPVQALALPHLDLSQLGFGAFRFRAGDAAARWDDVQRLLVAIKGVGNEDDPRVARLLGWFKEQYAEVLAEHLPRFAPLTPGELARLAANDRFRVGSHGHEHRILTRLAADDLADSLHRSRRVLAEITGRSIVDVAYPNGDHDERVLAAAAAAGYERGYGVRPAPIAGHVDALALPRLAVGAFDAPAILRFKIHRLLLAWRRTPGSTPDEG